MEQGASCYVACVHLESMDLSGPHLQLLRGSVRVSEGPQTGDMGFGSPILVGYVRYDAI